MQDLVSFVQFKKRGKHPRRSVTFGKAAGCKSIIPQWVFFTLYKLYKWYQIALNITNANLIFLNTLIHNPRLMLKWIQTTIIPRKIIKNRILNFGSNINTLSAKLTKWPNTFKQFVGNWPTNCLSVFGHFVGLALKGLMF